MIENWKFSVCGLFHHSKESIFFVWIAGAFGMHGIYESIFFQYINGWVGVFGTFSRYTPSQRQGEKISISARSYLDCDVTQGREFIETIELYSDSKTASWCDSKEQFFLLFTFWANKVEIFFTNVVPWIKMLLSFHLKLGDELSSSWSKIILGETFSEENKNFRYKLRFYTTIKLAGKFISCRSSMRSTFQILFQYCCLHIMIVLNFSDNKLTLGQ